MSIKSLGYIGINSAQRQQWQDFGCQVMGLEDVSERLAGANAESLYLKMDSHPFRIVVQPANTEGLAFCGWECNSAEGLTELADQLTAAGVEFQWADSELIAARRVQNLLQFKDPSGNCHEAYWGVVSDFVALNSPAGVPAFVTAEQGMGHIVLPAVNFDATVAFFQTLGFGLSDLMNIKFSPDPNEPNKRLWFMHCNERHHSLAFFEMEHPAGCIHLMTEVGSVDQVGLCNDRRIAHEIKLTGTLGRHANDHMVSFYMRSPSGFDIEYGAEGRTIADWQNYQVFESTVASFWGHDFSVGMD